MTNIVASFVFDDTIEVTDDELEQLFNVDVISARCGDCSNDDRNVFHRKHPDHGIREIKKIIQTMREGKQDK